VLIAEKDGATIAVYASPFFQIYLDE